MVLLSFQMTESVFSSMTPFLCVKLNEEPSKGVGELTSRIYLLQECMRFVPSSASA